MQEHFEILRSIRQNLIKILDQLSLSEVNKISEGFNNNIIWNAGHILVIQHLLHYGLSNIQVPLDKELIKKYAKGSQASDQTTQEEYDTIKRLLIETVDSTEKDYENGIFQEFRPYTVGLGNHLSSVEDAIIFNNVHEGLHLGYIMAQRKLV